MLRYLSVPGKSRFKEEKNPEKPLKEDFSSQNPLPPPRNSRYTEPPSGRPLSRGDPGPPKPEAGFKGTRWVNDTGKGPVRSR